MSDRAGNPELSQHQKRLLDLAFAMDCTSSMGPYIESAKNNIRTIVNEIVSAEHTDVRLALVEYRDHPPEDKTFVTQVHDFTANPDFMKRWLEDSCAKGGGDCPEALADALKDVLDLSWRDSAVKICVLISDAPPHGLGDAWDGYPNGCPLGLDPVVLAKNLAAKGVTIYAVGCEPAIRPYKDFFMALAYITGGQYVPLLKAQFLTRVIVGGAQEQISLEQYMAEVTEEVKAQVASGHKIDEDELVLRVHMKLQAKGANAKQLQRNDAELDNINSFPIAKQMSNLRTLSAMKPLQATVKPSYDLMSFDSGAPMTPRAIGAFDPLYASSAAGYSVLGIDNTVARTAYSPTRTNFGTPATNSCNTRPLTIATPSHYHYKVVDGEISLGQAGRMVQQAMARNQMK